MRIHVSARSLAPHSSTQFKLAAGDYSRRRRSAVERRKMIIRKKQTKILDCIHTYMYIGLRCAERDEQIYEKRNRTADTESVLFFSRPRFEGWPRCGRTLSVYLCTVSFRLTLPRHIRPQWRRSWGVRGVKGPPTFLSGGSRIRL